MKNVIFFIVFNFLFISESMLFAQNTEGLKYFVQAEQFRHDRKFVQAIVSLEEALKLEPVNANYMYTKGLCHLSLKLYDSAVKTFENALVLNNTHVNSYSTLAKLYTSKKQYDLAINAYDQVFKYETNKERKLAAILSSIALLYQTKKYEDAISRIEMEEMEEIDNKELEYWEARLENKTGDYEKAAEILQRLTKKFAAIPKQSDAKYYYELGYALFKLEKYKEATLALKKADIGEYRPKVYKLSADYFFHLSEAYFKVFEYEQAEAFLNLTLKIEPNHRKSLKFRKDVKQTLDATLPQRIEQLQDTIRKERRNGRRNQLFCNLCRMQFNTKDYVNAIVSANECLKSNSKNLNSVFYKSISLYKTESYEEASSLLSALATSPKMSPSLKQQINFTLGLIYAKMNQTEAARGYFKESGRGVFRYVSEEEIKKLDNEEEIFTEISPQN